MSDEGSAVCSECKAELDRPVGEWDAHVGCEQHRVSVEEGGCTVIRKTIKQCGEEQAAAYEEYRQQHQHPWDKLIVQRWQLDRLLAGLVEITSELDAATGADRLRMAAAAGFASGMAIALRMLVESMRRDEEVGHERG